MPGSLGSREAREGAPGFHFRAIRRAQEAAGAQNLAGITQWALGCAPSGLLGALPLLSRANLGIHVSEQNIEKGAAAHFRRLPLRNPPRPFVSKNLGGRFRHRMCTVLGLEGVSPGKGDQTL